MFVARQLHCSDDPEAPDVTRGKTFPNGRVSSASADHLVAETLRPSVEPGCGSVTFGTGSGDGVGRVIGGCPDTTGGGVGETGGSRVTGGWPVPVGSDTGCDLVEMPDGPTGFESLLQAVVNSKSGTARSDSQRC